MSDLNCINQNNKPSLRALAKQSSAGFKLKIDLDCFLPRYARSRKDDIKVIF